MAPALTCVLLGALLVGCATPTRAAYPPPKEENRPAPNPFVDREKYPGEDAKKTQFRPFYWKYEQGDRKEINVLGFVYRWREDEVFERLTVFPLIFYTKRKEPQELKSWFLYVFPILFAGDDSLLVFPFGGITRGMLGIHEIMMITPFFLQTRTFSSDRTNPIIYVVRHFPWPFFGYGTDRRPGGRRKYRIWPFWGKEIRRRDGSSKGFIGWPFYTWRVRSDTDKSFLLFPFYGRDETATQRSTTIMFPFYQRTRNFHSGLIDTSVWPFYRKAGGVDWFEQTRYWPFWQYRRADFTTTESIAWPFWRRTYVDNHHQFTRYTWALPFYREKIKVHRKDGSKDHKVTVWPFVRSERFADGGREVLIPQLLPVDYPELRKYAESFNPFVSFYHRRRWGDGRVDTSAAFSLYMNRKGSDFNRTSLLTGLVGWSRDPTGRYLRLLWGIRIKVGGPS